MSEKEKNAMEELCGVVRELREKCPWDSTQTLESLKERMVCETEEVLDAIERIPADRGENLCEELGDILMLVLLMSEIAGEQELFSLEDVIRGNSWKMKFRHPKIFAPEDETLLSLSWEELKAREKELRRARKEQGTD